MTRLVIYFSYCLTLTLFFSFFILGNDRCDGRRGTIQSRNDETITLDNSIVTLTSNHHVAPPIDHFLSIWLNDFKK